jgi:mRNA interferase RelE/StbE
MKTVVFTSRAARELDALPEKDGATVAEALFDYAVTGRGDVKKLSGQGGFRMRIGRYRVIFAEDGLTILAIYVGIRQTTTYRKH